MEKVLIPRSSRLLLLIIQFKRKASALIDLLLFIFFVTLILNSRLIQFSSLHSAIFVFFYFIEIMMIIILFEINIKKKHFP